MTFSDNISDFYHWMVQFGNVNTKSRTNYISWLKFMAGRYELDVDLSEDKIQTIINDERRALSSRTIYKSEKDLVNFKSALRKYKQFLDSNYSEVIQETILSETRKVQQDNSITLTEKRYNKISNRTRIVSRAVNFILVRVPITRCRLTNILIASHIKPWRTASNEERLDVFNGLLLTPNYDKLFDLGFIAFDNNGRILFSKEFPKSERTILGIDGHIRLVTIEEQHFKYLKFHRENCLIQ